MAKFANLVTVEIVPERKDEFLPRLTAHRSRCLKGEAGTLQFGILLPYDDDAKILSYEVYQDAVAFDMHRSGPSFAQFREEVAGMVTKISGIRCALLD